MPFISRDDVVVPEEFAVGGKPSRGTPADGRLAGNKSKGSAAASKPAGKPAFPGARPGFKPKK